MRAIEVRPDGTVTATNGHVLFSARGTVPEVPDTDFPQGHGVPPFTDAPLSAAVLLPAESAKRLIKGTARKATIPILQAIRVGATADGEHWACATDLQTPTLARLETTETAGPFPAWEKVLPAAGDAAIRRALRARVLHA